MGLIKRLAGALVVAFVLLLGAFKFGRRGASETLIHKIEDEDRSNAENLKEEINEAEARRRADARTAYERLRAKGVIRDPNP